MYNVRVRVDGLNTLQELVVKGQFAAAKEYAQVADIPTAEVTLKEVREGEEGEGGRGREGGREGERGRERKTVYACTYYLCVIRYSVCTLCDHCHFNVILGRVQLSQICWY